MSLEVQNQIRVDYTAANGGVNGAGAAEVNVPVGQGGNDTTNSAGVELGNTNTTGEKKTVRQAGEVDTRLNDIAKKTGLDKNTLVELIQKMTGKSYEDLLKLSQTDYNNLTVGLELILKSCIVNGKIDNSKLEKAIKDYSIASKTGWSLKGFYEQQQNVKKSTITQRLIETNCLDKAIDPNDPNYDSKMEAAIEKFFEKTLLSRINKNTSQAQREQIYKAQIQTFGRLLVNTPDGRDKELLGAAIDKLYRSNILSATKAGIDAMETTEAKANFARLVNKDYEKIVTTASDYEEDVYMNSKDAQGLAHVIFENLNADDVNKSIVDMKDKALAFYLKNKETLAIIAKKTDNQEKLTPEEEAIKRESENLYHARYAGAISGIACSTNSTVREERKPLLQTVTTDAYTIGEKAGNDFYREVIEQVSAYVEEHHEILTMSKDDFEKLMNEVTEGNYSVIVEDKAKGTRTELKAPSAANNKVTTQTVTADVKNTVSNDKNTDFGYKLNENVPQLTAPVTKLEQLYAQSNQQSQDAKPLYTDSTYQLQAVASVGSVEEVKTYAKATSNSYIEIALKLLNFSHISIELQKWALDKYDLLNNNLKAMACNNMKNPENKKEACDLITTVESLQRVQCNNGAVDKHIDGLIKEKQELMGVSCT